MDEAPKIAAEPVAVMKDRRWRVVAFIDVTDTPDPNYDVAAHDVFADHLYKQVEGALIAEFPSVAVEDVMCEDE